MLLHIPSQNPQPCIKKQLLSALLSGTGVEVFVANHLGVHTALRVFRRYEELFGVLGWLHDAMPQTRAYVQI